MTVYAAIESRIPANLATGKSTVIRRALQAGKDLQHIVNANSRRDDLSAKGRADVVGKFVRETTAPALARARRQYEYHGRELAKLRDKIRAKAIGEAQPTDMEWRSYLRTSSAGERNRLVLENADARGAALRAPALATIDGDIVAHATAAAIRENAPNESKALAAFEDAQKLHEGALRALTHELTQTPIITTSSGGVRKFVPFQRGAGAASECAADRGKRSRQ